MLISHPPLDSTFSSPVDSHILPNSSTDDSACYPLVQQGWPPATQSQDDYRSSKDNHSPPSRERRHPQPETIEDDKLRTAAAIVSKDTPAPREDRLSSSSLEKLLLSQLRDFCLHQNKNNIDHQQDKNNIDHQQDKNSINHQQDKNNINHQQDKRPNKTLPAAEAMSVVDPEEDLRCLVENDRQLELCGYYYGSLSWLDASHLLRQCKVGTFLVRDSEHGSYLYTLSVQTRKGPTSCRIEYLGGSFRLDSSKDLSHKMPRFDGVTNLIDFYVRLPRYLPLRNCNKAVWLDMDEENTLDVPVQIYRPLYRQVRSLQHMSRVAVNRVVDDRWGGDPLQGSVLPCKPYRTNPSKTLQTALEKDDECKQLPYIIKEYLTQYPYTQ